MTEDGISFTTSPLHSHSADATQPHLVLRVTVYEHTKCSLKDYHKNGHNVKPAAYKLHADNQEEGFWLCQPRYSAFKCQKCSDD